LKEQLQLLARLREVDDQIDHYENHMTRLPLEVQEIARNLVTIRREISEGREKLSEIEKEMRHKERDLGVEQEKIKLSEKRLLNIKNQKEYNALSRQVKLGKKVVGEIEETILGYMAEIENLSRAVERKEKEYEGFEESLKLKKAEEAEVTKEAQGALSSLNEEKAKIADALEDAYLKKYNTVKKALGSAVAEMENGSCTGCHMAIPPQLNIRVLKQEEIIYCPSCHRILYVKPENIPEYNRID
jgi:predicted  nucleic acid-binding Zn-ribbon protein